MNKVIISKGYNSLTGECSSELDTPPVSQIIDGEDVSECEFFSATGQCKIQQVFQRNEIVGIIEKPYGVHLKCNLCDKDCYYKQLKRLQAENEELIADIKSRTTCITCERELQNCNLQAENEQLKAENKRLKEENKQYKRYKYLFEKAKEFKEKSDKWAEKCLAENEDLKDTIKRTVCQAECFRYKQATKYKQTLQEIKEIANENKDTAQYRGICISIISKINEVIGVE